jgi:hypothetical protein
VEPIRNSIIKEKFRLYNDDVATMKEREIHDQLEREIKMLYKKSIPPVGDYLVRGAILGFFIAIFIGLANQSLSAFGRAWFFSLVGGVVIWGFKYVSIIEYNKSIEEKKLALNRKAQEDIRKAHEDSDRKTHEEIDNYDREVKTYFRKIKNNRKNLERMVYFACNIFDSALVDATKMASNAERFIKIDFKYTVSMTNIVYETSVGHSIIYDMKSHRYRNLDKDTECEALAAALRKMIGDYILKKYVSNQAQLMYGNNDANVILHFEMPNTNFVPATVII